MQWGNETTLVWVDVKSLVIRFYNEDISQNTHELLVDRLTLMLLVANLAITK